MIAAEPLMHIRLDAKGIAWIDRTNVQVIEIIVDHLAYGHGPEEIQLQHPHLSLAQVHAAFAYYFDHQADLDADVERRYHRPAAFKEKAGKQPSRKKLMTRLKPR